MSNTHGFDKTISPPLFRPLSLPWEALAGVRRRRIIAICFDLILVSVISFALAMLLFVFTIGLSLVILPPLFPFVAFFYNGFSISGWRMATPGMRAMDLEMRLINGQPVPFFIAAVHAVLFYLSWMFPPILLVSLVTSDKRCLHDIFAGVIVTRRSA